MPRIRFEALTECRTRTRRRRREEAASTSLTDPRIRGDPWLEIAAADAPAATAQAGACHRQPATEPHRH
ncbi:hypothetical protein BHE74_00003389 [Ensete ventricosum]|nr:hypothetical protein GW17_00016354 [Ensete ventricosum]RWW87760.1 hypothetical protein BHE74_00003389 [Ensete ventricosum]